MISEQRANAPRGSYEAQRWLAVEEADELAEIAKQKPNEENFLLYGYVARAFYNAAEIAKMALCKTPLSTEQFVARQVRFYEYGKRVFDFPDLGKLVDFWPKSPGTGIIKIVRISALDEAIQFITRIYHRVGAARETTWPRTTSRDKLPVCPNPDPVFTKWRDMTIRELKEKTLLEWKMWKIRRDGDSLLYILEDEYKRSLKPGPSHLK